MFATVPGISGYVYQSGLLARLTIPLVGCTMRNGYIDLP